jgi:3-oxoacyl-[acyl-carrier protein] reductase
MTMITSLAGATQAFSLAGRVAIITGAGKGIGSAIAKVFAAAGVSIVVATRTAASGQATVDDITAMGGNAILVVCDVGKRATAVMIAEAAISRFGRIDILLHNAAVYPMCAIADLSDEMLEETLAVNLKAAFWLTAAALPHLRQSPSPRILITSSVTGPRVALPGLAHYAASKAGLNGFIRAAAMEYARDGITVNGVEPGLIHTDAIDALGDAEVVAGMARAIPLKRLGRPEEIALAMQYLASDAAAFVTGQTIIVDGGALLPENLSALD